MSLKIVVLSSRLEQLMISPEESCFLRFLSFFFFFLYLAKNSSQSLSVRPRECHLFFFLSSLSASSFISLEFVVHLHPYGCFRRLCVCVCMFTYSSPTRA